MANNQYVNKVVFGSVSIIDISPTTAVESDVAQGKIFFKADGSQATGTHADQGVSVVTTQDQNGGDIVTITGTVAQAMNPWVMRSDAELIKTYTYDKYIVEDEEKTIPGYTTSATTLIAATNLSPTVTLDYANYNYYVAIRCLTIPSYNISSKAKGRCEYSFASAMYEIIEYPANTISALITPTTKLTARSTSVFAAGNDVGLIYWSDGTKIARYASAAYATAQTVTAPSVSGTTLTLKSPAFIVRGHTTYFTSTYMNALTDIRYQYVIEVYRAPKNHLSFNGWGLYNMSNKIIECADANTHKLT